MFRNIIHTAAARVAWIVTGNLRTFFAPLVHESLLRNAILAVGGDPRLFFSAAADDEAKSGMVAHDLASPSRDLRGAGRSHHACTTRYDNLSHFLARHPEWARLTAHVSEATEARPPREALDNPRCSLDAVGWSMHPRDFAQLWRWRDALHAVERDERSGGGSGSDSGSGSGGGRRFDFVARLRFDLAVAAPLPADLLDDARAAHLSWPCWYKPRARLLPLPDHFFVVPRAFASDALDLLGRYLACEGTAFEDSLRLLHVRQGANDNGNASSASPTLRDGPPLCCGYGPTGRSSPTRR